MSRRDFYKKQIEECFTEESSAEVETMAPETKEGKIVNALFVNARKEPSAKAEVYVELRRGDEVTIVGKVGNYYQIEINYSQTAYVNADYVEVKEG